jgi:hypothetical protein
LKVETPAWIGQYLFGCNDSPISQELPVVTEETNNLLEARIPKAKETFKNVNFWGFFQYHTKYYAPHKEYFISLFKPVLAIENQMKEALDCLRSRGKTIVGLHLRRGDYGYSDFFIAPSEWYKEWLKGLWETLDEPILFIASDEPEKVLRDFEEYNPVTTKELGLELPEAEFYPDFYLLSQCDITAISNSSFSFAACMLNEKGKFFFRPHLSSQKLIPFDPWDSEPFLRTAKVIGYTNEIHPELITNAKTINLDLIEETIQNLNLRELNLIIFPNWHQPEESLSGELSGVIKAVLAHRDRSRITLLIDSSEIDREDANLILCSVTMNLLLEEDLDVGEVPEITLIGQMSEIQWEILWHRLRARIVLDRENKQMAHRAGNLPHCTIENFANIKL